MNKLEHYVPAIGLRAVSSKERIKHLEERLAAFEESERKLVRELAEANTISGKKTGEIAMLQETNRKHLAKIAALSYTNMELAIDVEMSKVTYQNMRNRIVGLQNHNERLNVIMNEGTK